MELIGHQDVGQYFCLVDVNGSLEEVKRDGSVKVVSKDPLTGITSTGHMIVGILKLDSKRPRHKLVVYQTGDDKSRIADLTPHLLHAYSPW